MANKHLLSLDIPDVNNPFLFKVNDSSLYADNLGRNCGHLFIVPPGFIDAVKIDVTPDFKLIINACELGIQTKDCGESFAAIPDGIYHIRYSVAPNTQVFVEYQYLRLTNINNYYYNELAKLELRLADPDAEINDTLKELRLIRSFLDAAKAKVENAHLQQEGTDLLAYASRRLKKLMETCN